MEEQYPNADQTREKIVLKPKSNDMTVPPERLLIVGPNPGCVDVLL